MMWIVFALFVPLVLSERTKAICKFENTTANAAPVTGTMTFVKTTGSTAFTISYDIRGLSAGPHGVEVRAFGDLVDVFASTTTGSVFEGVCSNCRPAGRSQLVGNLNNGDPIMATATSATGSFMDNAITLSGDNSILGRSVVIKGSASDPNVVVGQCVVGIDEADDPGTETSQTMMVTSRATCLLRATSLNKVGSASGIIYFDQDRDSGSVRIWYTMNGLSNGPHAFHVHQRGNIVAEDGTSTLGHFKGTCDKCRPEGLPQEVGLLQDGLPVYADQFGSSAGIFYDKIITLNGPNSIIGRSLVVHGIADDAGVKALQCVIGKSAEFKRAYSRPAVKRAVCSLLPTRLTGGAIGVKSGFGNVTFDANEDGTLTVNYAVVGLREGNHAMFVADWGVTMTDDGLGTGGRFIGQCALTKCKADGARQEVGSLNDGIPIVADSSNLASGVFVEKVAKLSGRNSIVGRSVVIVGNSTSDDAVVAQCVIGVGELNEPLDPFNLPLKYLEDPPIVTEAFCHMRPNEFIPNNVALGTFWFRSLGDAGTQITYFMDNLSPGYHEFHVHTTGDISATDSSMTGPHFFGSCNQCRPAGKPQEVGLLNDGNPVWATASGVSTGMFIDKPAKLNGIDSIIGRSIVIHAAKEDGGKKIAQCVIGINKEERDPAEIAAAAAKAGYDAAVLEAKAKQTSASEGTSKVNSKPIIAGLAAGCGILAIALVAAIAFAKKGGSSLHSSSGSAQKLGDKL